MRQIFLTAILAGILLAGCGGSDTGGGAPSPNSSVSLLAETTTVNGTVVLPGTRDSFTIARTSTGFTATNRATGATTPISGAASITFDDATVALGIGDLSKIIPAADLKTLVELYTAFFNRIPDADGMAYWIGRRAAGDTLVQIAESFYAAAVSPQFSALTGYGPSMNNSDFVTVIYKNVLGRSSVDAEGMLYWSGRLADGSETPGSLVLTILSSAHTFKGNATFGFVADLLDNKYAVGSYYALQQGITFRSDIFSKSAAIAQAVTPTDTASAQQMFPLVDNSFSLMLEFVPVANLATVQAIINQRCIGCHSMSPGPAGFVNLRSEAEIRNAADKIYQVTVLSQVMPPDNVTGMTDAERNLIERWIWPEVPPDVR